MFSFFYFYYWKGHIEIFFDKDIHITLPEMVLIPGGWFEMGDTFGDGLGRERPAHKVYVSPYKISKYDITNKEYSVFVQETYPHYYKPDGYWYERNFNSPRQPVVGVSWYDAQAYCLWLSNKTGRKLRLPTEAEWEFAARGGLNNKKYPWGNEISPGGRLMGNFPDETARNGYKKKNRTIKTGYDIDRWTILKGYNDGYIYTSPVGAFPANGYGLYDMSGNVWQWCEDWYEGGYYIRSAGVKDPVCTDSSSGNKIIRGGSWYYSWKYLTVSTRQYYPPWKKYGMLGFRIVEEL